MHKRNKTGPNMEPLGTPKLQFKRGDVTKNLFSQPKSFSVYCSLKVRNDSHHFEVWPRITHLSSLFKKELVYLLTRKLCLNLIIYLKQDLPFLQGPQHPC